MFGGGGANPQNRACILESRRHFGKYRMRRYLKQTLVLKGPGRSPHNVKNRDFEAVFPRRSHPRSPGEKRNEHVAAVACERSFRQHWKDLLRTAAPDFSSPPL
jgi:hypothetical protein